MLSSHTPTFVLVPGAWQAGWSCLPVARRLRARGYHAVTCTLPGLGHNDARTGVCMDDAVAHLVAEIERRELRDVVLVGHSWGGYPITGAAHQVAGRLAGVAYVNAVVPEKGVPMVEENQQYAAITRAAIDASPEGSIAITLEQVPILVPELPEAAQRLFHELLVPMPGAYFLESLDADDVRSLDVPMNYILSDDDRALARPGAEFAARIGLTPVQVPGGHQSMLTFPDEVVDALLATDTARS